MLQTPAGGHLPNRWHPRLPQSIVRVTELLEETPFNYLCIKEMPLNVGLYHLLAFRMPLKRLFERDWIWKETRQRW